MLQINYYILLCLSHTANWSPTAGTIQSKRCVLGEKESGDGEAGEVDGAFE